MAYSLRKERRAAAEVDWLKVTYGAAFATAFDKWTASICEQCEGGGELESAEDIGRVLDDLITEDLPSDLKQSWQRVKASGWIERAKALLATIRNRRPPWRARVLERHDLPGLSGHISVAIRMYVSIDDLKKQVVVRAVDQLPS